jgi:hypothetical protein
MDNRLSPQFRPLVNAISETWPHLTKADIIHMNDPGDLIEKVGMVYRLTYRDAQMQVERFARTSVMTPELSNAINSLLVSPLSGPGDETVEGDSEGDIGTGDPPRGRSTRVEIIKDEASYTAELSEISSSAGPGPEPPEPDPKDGDIGTPDPPRGGPTRDEILVEFASRIIELKVGGVAGLAAGLVHLASDAYGDIGTDDPVRGE